MISQDWFKQWLGAVKQQDIVLIDTDKVIWGHRASLGYNELIAIPISQFLCYYSYKEMIKYHWSIHQNIFPLTNTQALSVLNPCRIISLCNRSDGELQQRQ